MNISFFGDFRWIGKDLKPYKNDHGMSLAELLNSIIRKYNLTGDKLNKFVEKMMNSNDDCIISLNGNTAVDLNYIPKEGDDIKIGNKIYGKGGKFGASLMQIVVGVGLVALAFFNPFAFGAAAVTALYATGFAFTINGFFGLVFGGPKVPSVDQQNEERQSRFFNGPSITTGEGSMGPWGYGLALVGGHLCSARIDNVSVGQDGEPVKPPDGESITIPGFGIVIKPQNIVQSSSWDSWQHRDRK